MHVIPSNASRLQPPLCISAQFLLLDMGYQNIYVLSDTIIVTALTVGIGMSLR